MKNKILELENVKMEKNLENFVTNVFPNFRIYENTLIALSQNIKLELITYWVFYWFEEKIHALDAFGIYLNNISNGTDFTKMQNQIERMLNVNV